MQGYLCIKFLEEELLGRTVSRVGTYEMLINIYQKDYPVTIQTLSKRHSHQQWP